MIFLNCELLKTGRNGNPKVGRKPHFSSSLKISNAEVSMSSTGENNVCCSIKRSTTCSKMLLLARLHCQWSVLRRPSATCADVCGNETAHWSGFCVLLHLFKGVTGFTLFLTAVVKRVVPLIASIPTFPQYRELLRENGPEMKRNFVMFRLETGQHQKPSWSVRGVAQIPQHCRDIRICE